MTCFSLIFYLFSGKFYRRACLLVVLNILGLAAFAQKPSISYNGSSPYIYTINSAIDLLYIENRGGVVPTGVQTSVFSTGYNVTPAVAADADYLYVCDAASNIIKKVDKVTGTVSVFAGTGVQGASNGTVDAATFNMPTGIVLDGNGNIYVADQRNNLIRKISVGTVTTFAGSGSAGAADATGTAASFNSPAGLAIDAAGDVYVADQANNIVRKITPAGVVTTVGTGFNIPTGVAVDADGTIYVADAGSGSIKKISPGGIVSTFASGFSYPRDVKIDKSGFVYVTEQTAGLVKKVDPLGNITSFTVSANNPMGLALDETGVLYVADGTASRILKVNLGGFSIDKPLPVGLSFNPETGDISGTPTVTSPLTNYTITATNASGSGSTTISIRVSSVAPPASQPPVISYTTPNQFDVGASVSLTPSNTGGTVPTGTFGQVSTFAGSGTAATVDGSGTSASFKAPQTIAKDADGNLYVVETANRVIRKITPAGVVSIFAGTPGVQGNADGPLLSATFSSPFGIVVDRYGNLFVSDAFSHVIRKIDVSTNIVSTFAGAAGASGLINGTGSLAWFKNPSGMAIDANDNIYVADLGNNVIRKIQPDGTVSTFSGSGIMGTANGAPSFAQFVSPKYISIDPSGNFYVTGSTSFNIRKLTSGGEVSTIPGLSFTTIGSPAKVIGRADGSIIIASFANKNQILEVTSSGAINVLAGSGSAGTVDATGAAASFNNPMDMVYGSDGNLYITDASNNTIRKLIVTGYVIDKSPPEGITFNQSTGVFGGSPVTSFPATNYTVTAYNSAGASQPFVVNIGVNGAADVIKPNISYATPKVYNTGTAITPLVPVNTGGAVPEKIYASGIENTADLDFPRALAVDKFGFMYAVEWGLHQVDRVNVSTNVVERIAGKTAAGSTDGVGDLARFNYPNGIAVSADGNIYVADKNNKSIRKITWGMPGTVSTISTGFTAPYGLAIDAAGSLYISDQGAGTVSKRNMQTGTIAVIATGLNSPSGIDVDADGNIYVAETGANVIKKISAQGVVSIYKTGFNAPHDVKVDGSGNLYVTDEQNTGSIKRISANTAKDVTTISNNNAERPVSLALDKRGSIYIGFDKQVRKLNISGYTIDKTLPAGLVFDPKTGIISGTPTINTPATDYVITAYNGGGSSTFTVNIKVDGVTIPPTGTPPDIAYATPQVYTINKKISDLLPVNKGGSVPATVYGASVILMSNLTSVRSIFVDADGMLYVTGSNQIKKINPVTLQVMATYGTGAFGTDNAPGSTATFSNPYGIVADADGNIFVADNASNLIRKISTTGVVSTFAGSGAAGNADGTGSSASFNTPKGMAIDAAGNIYVADQGSNAIRKITPAGVVTTVAAGPLNAPNNVTLDKAGNLYINDSGTNSVKKVAASGTVTTVATGISGLASIQVDVAGNLFIGAASGGRKISPTGDVESMPGIGSSGAMLDGAGNMYNTSVNGVLSKMNLTGYTIDRPLPDGLVFDSATGKLSGTPTVTTGSVSFTYVVTAYNGWGSSKASFTIRINNSELIQQNITFAAIPSKLVCDAPFTVTATSSNNAIPIVYSSSNTAIATVNASTGLITIKGLGTVVITATQAGNSTYAATEQQQSLVITDAAKPDVNITADKAIICVGDAVTYTANLTSNVGMGTLSYQWQVNNSNVGTNQNTFISSTLGATDKVTCSVTNTVVVNNTPCINTGTKNIDAIKPNTIQTVQVTISSSVTGPVCSGADVSFTAVPTPNDDNVTYQWKLNGVNVGTNSDTYKDNKFADGDIVTCVFTNTTTPCVVGNPATSNAITVNILPPDSPAPSVIIKASTNSTYAENPITFTATPQNASGTIIYQWQVNGTSVGTNSASFTTTSLKNADKVSLVMISGTCGVPAQSNDIYPTILPPLAIVPPNTFTPNGDGVNDLWLISGLSTYPNCIVNVYNRHGDAVFRSKGYTQPWDGLYKSNHLPVGTYYYVIDLANGKPSVSGYITIIR